MKKSYRVNKKSGDIPPTLVCEILAGEIMLVLPQISRIYYRRY